jgi:hypothetical protein
MEMKKQWKAEEWKASSEHNVKMQENPGSLLKNCNYQSFHAPLIYLNCIGKYGPLEFFKFFQKRTCEYRYSSKLV